MEEIFEKIRSVLEKEEKVIFAYVFGSFLINPEYANDIDIGIYVEGEIDSLFEERLALKIENEIKNFIRKEVHVTILNNKPTSFFLTFFKNSKLIFSRDENKRINFEMEKMREVFEYKRLAEEYEKYRLIRYGIE